jgi:hypothetical protein
VYIGVNPSGTTPLPIATPFVGTVENPNANITNKPIISKVAFLLLM